MGRESMNLRGQVFELDSSGKTGPDGMPSAITIRGVTPTGDAGETFAITAGKARWKSPIDAGSASYSAPAFYVSQAGPIDTNAWLVEALLARPDKTMNLLPGGKRARRRAGGPRRRQRRGEADHHVVGDLRHQHVTLAGLGRREQQVLRRSLRPRVAARGVRGRASEDSGCAGERDGGAGAGAAQVPRQGAGGTSRIQRRAVVRRRGRAVPGQPDGGRRQRHHHGGPAPPRP